MAPKGIVINAYVQDMIFVSWIFLICSESRSQLLLIGICNNLDKIFLKSIALFLHNILFYVNNFLIFRTKKRRSSDLDLRKAFFSRGGGLSHLYQKNI